MGMVSNKVKKISKIYSAVIISITFLLFQVPAASAAPPDGYALTFSEECEGPLDYTTNEYDTGSKWWVRDKASHGSLGHENTYRASAITVSDGVCRITATKVDEVVDGETWHYRSGEMNTLHRFGQSFGYYEARVKIPRGQGLWSSWWLYPKEWSPGTPEMDIFEIMGTDPGRHFMTYFPTSGTPTYPSSIQNIFEGADLSAAYHDYGVLWEPGLMVWYVDGTERARVSGGDVPANSTDVSLFLSLAVGGVFPESWGGGPDETTPAVSYMDIDWIKAYQGNGSNTCTPNWQCSGWSACSNGQQTQTCTDSNDCGTTSGQPATSQSCGTSGCTNLNFISGSVSPTSVSPGDSYTMHCDYGTQIDSIDPNPGSGSCDYTDFSDTTANFACTAGPTSGAFSNYCSLRSGTSDNTCARQDNINDLTVTGSIQAYCGDQSCNNGETCSSCSDDCGTCPTPPPPTTTYTLSDFTNLVADWLKSMTGSPADISLDNKVNSRDLGIMMSNWETSNPAPIPQESCGNGTCVSSESCSSCPGDCGSCPVPPPPSPTPGDALVSGSFENGMTPFTGPYYGGAEVVTDGTAPDGTKSLRFNYTTESVVGNAPDIIPVDFEPTDEVWVQYYFKAADNYDFGSWGVKNIYLKTGPDAEHVNFYTAVEGSWGETYSVHTQHNTDSNLNQSFYYYGNDIVAGNWYKVTMHVTMNDAGSYNGVMQIWLNDTLIINQLNVLYRLDGQSTGFNHFQFFPSIGGSISETTYVYFDHVIIQTTPFVF